jgi:hypothetical protein
VGGAAGRMPRGQGQGSEKGLASAHAANGWRPMANGRHCISSEISTSIFTGSTEISACRDPPLKGLPKTTPGQHQHPRGFTHTQHARQKAQGFVDNILLL